MDLQSLGKHWERFGRTDPLWAVLSAPDKKHNRWDTDEFFESGRHEISRVMELVEVNVGVTRPQGRALDFGCGVGRLTQALAGWYDRCDGVDIAPSMVARAEQYNRERSDDPQRCRFHLNTRDDLSLFADDSFDFVYTAHVLQHMEPQYARRYVEEFCRVTQPCGYMLFEMVSERPPGATEPLPDDAFDVRIAPLDLPVEWAPGQTATVTLSVCNLGGRTLPAAGTDGWFQVTVGNHWLSPDGRVVVLDDGREPLPDDLSPGRELRVSLDVTAPKRLGRYYLGLDCVQEGVGWFADRGSTPTRVPAVVGGRAAANAYAAVAAELVAEQIRTWRAARRGGSARETASAVAEADDRSSGAATMEMHGVPEDEVAGWIKEAGARLLTVVDWDSISGQRGHDWCRRGYLVAPS